MGDKSLNTCWGMSSLSFSVCLGVDEAINFFATCCFELSTSKELIDLVILIQVKNNPIN
jgi:hypothetical protein